MWKGLWIPIAKESFREGYEEAAARLFRKLILRGLTTQEAMEIAEITEEQAKKALEEIGEKSPV